MASSQKFIARNRAPRVQIEYDVELYGAEKKVQLPFVMGVMSDLAGKSEEPQPSIEDRKFLDIDVDNFDDRMKAMKPRAAFTVPNTLTGEGNLAVDITFESMDDFSPTAIASKIEPLRELLQARTQLSNLMTYMDGKTGAETLIETVLQDGALLSALASGKADDVAQSAVLDTLRAQSADIAAASADAAAQEGAKAQAALDALRAATPTGDDEGDQMAAALDALRAAPPVANDETNFADAALDALRASAPKTDDAPDDTAAVLAALRATPAKVEEAADQTVSALEKLRVAPPVANDTIDATANALEALRAATPVEAKDEDVTDAALDALRATKPLEDETPDVTDAALDALRAATPDTEPETDETTSALEALRSAEAPTEEMPDITDAALDALRAAPPAMQEGNDDAQSALDALRNATPEAEEAPDTTDAALEALLSSTPMAEAIPDGADAALEALRSTPPEAEDTGEGTESALRALKDTAPIAEAEPDQTDDVFDALRDNAADTDAEADPLDGLADLLGAEPDQATAPPAENIEVDDPLAGLDNLPGETPSTTEPTAESLSEDDTVDLDLSDDPDEAVDPLADLLADAAPTGSEENEDPLTSLQDLLGDSVDDADPLADLLADAAPTMDALEEDTDSSGLRGLLDTGDGDALADLLADSEPDAMPETTEDPLSDLDIMLDGTDDAATPDAQERDVTDPQDDPLAGLDDLLAEPAPETDPLDGPDDLLTSTTEAAPAQEPDPLDDLDALLAESEAVAPDDSMSLLDDLLGDPEPPSGAPLTPFGTLSAPQPSPESLHRPQFRMAIFGDFSGRASRGQIEIGDELATRRAIKFDVDTVEDVIEGFATNLILPIGPDGQGIEVKLGGLDDLHPDELVDNLDLFDALKGLRARLANASTAASAIREMQGWGQTFTSPAAATHSRSSAASIPADKKLSDFQQLIGDTSGRLTQASPIDDMIGQIIGPHVVPGPNAEAAALMENVDASMSSAMRLVLHHPEFQAIESQWRSLDLLARRVETDVKLTITLFDVSAEEIAADLAASDDLAQSGLFRLLNEPLEEEGGIGFSALFGMYTFEETPPHAELLARLGQIAAHIHAPFFTAMAPGFMNTQLKDRHPLTAAAWDKLRKEPAAAYLGLVSPRFLLRRPYGKKTDPIDAFAFEEFTQHEGLKGMLWANPVTLVAVLLAQAWKDGGPKMTLGDVMSMDDLPFHFVTDQYGDQVALPCTERNLTESLTRLVVTRGFMPVVSIRGRDIVRLASFQSLAGAEIAGPWSGPPTPRAPAPETSELDVVMEIPVAPAPLESPEPPRAETPADLPRDEATPKAAPETSEPAEDDLDALLASFGEFDAPADPDAIDADLAALLEGL